MRRKNDIKKIIKGSRNADQVIVLIEECSELIKEMTKALRGEGSQKRIAEELGDVQLMIYQACIIFNIDPAVLDEVIDWKIDRTLKKMEEEKNDKSE